MAGNADGVFPFCDEVGKYEKLAKVGQGTFGEVFKARHRQTRQVVALKKILMENEKEGFPITALRELRILKLLQHENIVNILEVCRTKASGFNRQRPSIYLVFEYCEHDLAGLLRNRSIVFSMGEVKKVIQMLCNALYFIHYNKILHRDLKSANVLITKTGILKLADFGLARGMNAERDRYTNRVVTLWYRPPELLLGERNYGPPIDMWGVGCIMAEMWTCCPIMQGSTEQIQLNLISSLCGTICPEVWPNVKKLELFSKLQLPKSTRKVKERLRQFVNNAHALDLVDKLLTLDPYKRYDADSALNHDFFWSDPMPCDLTKTLSKLQTSNFELLTAPRQNNRHRTAAPGNTIPSQAPSQNMNPAIYDRVY